MQPKQLKLNENNIQILFLRFEQITPGKSNQENRLDNYPKIKCSSRSFSSNTYQSRAKMFMIISNNIQNFTLHLKKCPNLSSENFSLNLKACG